jgi:Mycolic acid cyclopropane synthetase
MASHNLVRNAHPGRTAFRKLETRRARDMAPTVQVITMPDARYQEYCTSSDFIREHIFPGGHLPSMGAMTAFAGAAGLSAISAVDIGPDYAITLRVWRSNWVHNWDAIRKLGYPETFLRKCAPDLRTLLNCIICAHTALSGVAAAVAPQALHRSCNAIVSAWRLQTMGM